MTEQIFFLTHKKNAEIEQLIRSIRDQMGDRTLTIVSQSHHFNIEGTELFLFDESIVQEMAFPAMSNSIVPGNVHFPVFSYLEKYQPAAEYYWIIEYDVRFTADWSVLFDYFIEFDHDLITSHIHYYHQEPEWYWWDISHPELSIPLEQRIRSFNPIYRISTHALRFLEQAFKSGWKGHNEATFPTLLHHNGFRLLDFNGSNGDFQSQPHRFYISRSDRNGKLWTGTMRYRPAMRNQGLRKNKLYHPVKSEDGLGFIRSNVGNFYRLVKWLFNKIYEKEAGKGAIKS